MFVAVNQMYESIAQDCMDPDTKNAIASTAVKYGEIIHIFKPWGEHEAEAYLSVLKRNNVPFETDVGNH